MQALIDQDLLCYRCAASAENDDLGIAIYRIDELLDNILNKTGATSYRAFLTSPTNFRKDIYPEYKANRTPPSPEEKDHFDQFFAELNSVADDMPYQTFKLFGVEADDIITYLSLKLKTRYPHIWIVSSDRDLYQLLDDNVSIFNLFSRKELTKRWLWEEKGLTAEQHKLSKIIQGDKSDNINGIEGIGEKRGDDLAKTYKTIGNLFKHLPLPGKTKYIKNLNSGIEILKRNEQLINLTENVRNIVTYGPKGDEHLRILEEFSTKIMDTYPEVVIQPVILPGEMTTTHLNKLGSMIN